MQTNAPIRRGPVANGTALAMAAGLSSVAAGLALGLNGTGNLGWHAATRITAVLAFPLWWCSFVAGPAARLWLHPALRALRRQRRPIGVAFAAALAVHGVAIVMLSRSEPEVLAPGVEVIFGGLGFAFAFAMAATSTDTAARRLGGPRWRALHRTGQWVIFVIFAASYGGRFAVELAYWPGALGLASALGLRIAAFVRSRSHTRRAVTG